MAELGIAQKTEIGATQKPTKEFRIEGRLEHRDVLNLVKEITEPLSNDEFARRLNSIAKKPVDSPTEINTSLMKVEKTNTAITKAGAPIIEITPTPQRPKTKEELKEAAKEVERLANLAAKRERERWNRDNRSEQFYAPRRPRNK